MIYEYPKEFIVPVVYIKDLQEESSHRQKRNKSLREWKLLILEEGLQGDEIISGSIDTQKSIESQDMNFLDMEKEILQEPYEKTMFNDNIVEKSAGNENIKSILNDVDEEYAISETLSM